MNRKIILHAFFVSFVLTLFSFGPPNCNLFDGNCKLACHEAEKAITYSQGSRASQEHFNKSIALCPEFDYSYYEKAVPYAKRGQMDEWKLLIDKAVELNPVEFLSQRGWYHFFFMHNYSAAIQDIETLDSLMQGGDIGETGDAIYHLNVLKALCHKQMGNSKLALKTLKNQMAKEDHYDGLYDHIHLGVMYLNTEKYEEAIKAFEIQIKEYPISEAYFYLGKTFQALNNNEQYLLHMKKAKDYYVKGEKMHNSYRQLIDEIYLSDIEDELKSQ